jgi:uncharacterized membrane protein YkvA (DUF1232 family)
MNLADLARALRSPLVPRWQKLLGFAGVAYLVFPFDGVPDVIPVLGWLDDAGVLGLVLAVLLRERRKQPPGAVVIDAELPGR